MTEEQIAIAKAFYGVTFLPASREKRFARDMIFLADNCPNTDLSPKQDRYLRLVAYRFRRQMPNHLVPAEKPA